MQGNEISSELKKVLMDMLDASHDGFTYTDRDGRILYTNKAYNRLTGLSNELLIGNNMHELAPKGYPISNMMMEVFCTRKPLTEVIRYPDSTGEILVTISPFYNEEGVFMGAVANVRDYTEISHLREQLSLIEFRYNEVIEEHMRSQGISENGEQYQKQLERLASVIPGQQMVARSARSEQLKQMAYRISRINSTIHITGESGVGKDVFARLVHAFRDPSKAFVKISCGAIPETLMESELFGYEAGAFTSAARTGKMGIFELAGDGTIMLDEVGELPVNLQVKLLTVLQDREFYRIGGTKRIQMNARIISATNKDLKQEVKEGRFREDLYYRLNVIPVAIPPLRERKEDIVPIALETLNRLNRENKTEVTLSPDVCNNLEAYAWPGNVRELNNVIERMYVFSDGQPITSRLLPDELNLDHINVRFTGQENSLKQMMQQVESKIILDKLRTGATLTKAAKDLGVDVSTLSRKVAKYGLMDRVDAD